jgi:hypothetical protein
MAVKNAAALLEGFVADGIAIEVTHRAKRRLCGLAALTPLREEVAPPESGSCGSVIRPIRGFANMSKSSYPSQRLEFSSVWHKTFSDVTPERHQ